MLVRKERPKLNEMRLIGDVGSLSTYGFDEWQSINHVSGLGVVPGGSLHMSYMLKTYNNSSQVVVRVDPEEFWKRGRQTASWGRFGEEHSPGQFIATYIACVVRM